MNREQRTTARKGTGSPSRMERDARSIAKGELIGLRVTVASSSDARKAGLGGVVVDETMHTLTIDTGSKVVMVAKPECSFRFERTGKAIAGEGLSRDERSPAGFRAVEVRGADLDVRPEDRIKKVR